MVSQRRQAVEQPQAQQQEKRIEQRFADSDAGGGEGVAKKAGLVDSLGGADAIWAQEVEGPPSKAPPPQSPIYRVMPAPPEARSLNESMPLPPSADGRPETVLEATACVSARGAQSEPVVKYKAMPQRSPPPKCGGGAGSGGEPSPLRAWSAGGEGGPMGPPPAPASACVSPIESKRYKAPPAECASTSADGDWSRGHGREACKEDQAGDSWQGVKSSPESPQLSDEYSGGNANGSSQQKRLGGKVKAPPTHRADDHIAPQQSLKKAAPSRPKQPPTEVR